jgi:hypothetical protein
MEDEVAALVRISSLDNEVLGAELVGCMSRLSTMDLECARLAVRVILRLSRFFEV